MALLNVNDILEDAILITAKQMIAAAKTAPKAKGNDNLFYAIVTGNDIKLLADKMQTMGEAGNRPSFIRDSKNVRLSTAVVLIGTRIKTIGLGDMCGLCGFKNCTEKEKHADIPCIYNTSDLGTAAGSAVQTAMQNKIDNRIMFSIGMAAREMQLLPVEARIIYGIPLSAHNKSIYFDRP